MEKGRHCSSTHWNSPLRKHKRVSTNHLDSTSTPPMRSKRTAQRWQGQLYCRPSCCSTGKKDLNEAASTRQREARSPLRLRCRQSRPRPHTARSHHSLVWGSCSLHSARRKRHTTACFHLTVRAAATWMDGAWWDIYSCAPKFLQWIKLFSKRPTLLA